MTSKSLRSLLHARGLLLARAFTEVHRDFLIGRAVSKRGREVQILVSGLEIMQYGRRKLKRLVNQKIDAVLAPSETLYGGPRGGSMKDAS